MLHLNTIQNRQIPVQHDLPAANRHNHRFNCVFRHNFIWPARDHLAVISTHHLHGNSFLRSARLSIRTESAENLGETRRKVLEKILSAFADVIPRADIVPAHYSIAPGACSRGALRTDLLHDLAPIPFVVVGALRDRTPATGYNTPTAHFRNRRCLAKCRRRLGRAFALKPAEEASSFTFQIGHRGSRRQHPLQNRPPTLQAFRSVLSRTRSVSTHGFHGSRSYLRRHGVQSQRAHT